MKAALVDKVPIGRCVEAVSTWNPKLEANTNTFRYIDISSVDQAAKKIVPNGEIPVEEAPSRARQLVKTGDILVSTVRPNLNAVAFVPSELNGSTASTGFCVLRPKLGKLHGRYLFHWVQTKDFITDMVRKATGQSYPAVSDRIVKESVLPLPCVEEQRRIASILDQADALRSVRRRSVDRLNDLGQSIFYEMFGDPKTNRHGWKQVKLGDVASFYSGNSLPEGEEFKGQAQGYLLLKVSDLNYPENIRRIETSTFWSEKPGSQAGTCPATAVIFPKRGGAIGTNKKRVLPRAAILDPNLMGVVPTTNVMHPEFLFGWFNTFNLSDIASGSSVPQLNKQDLAPLRLFLPPITLQHEYSVVISTLVTLLQKTRRAQCEIDSLFYALQQRAFRGEL